MFAWLWRRFLVPMQPNVMQISGKRPQVACPLNLRVGRAVVYTGERRTLTAVLVTTVNFGATIATRPRSRGPSGRLFGVPGSGRRPAATRFVTASPPTCSMLVRTSGPFRSCWGTGTSARPWPIRTSLDAARMAFGARSTATSWTPEPRWS